MTATLAAPRHPSIAVPGTMTAMRVHRYGGPEAIVADEVALPVPGEGQLLVRVHAAGVGPWDAQARAGRNVPPQPLPLIPGAEVSGTVALPGPGVTGFVRGEAVFGVTNRQFTGGYAEYALVEAGMAARKPVSLSHAEAASAPVAAVTAAQMLFDHAGLQPGQRVLIHGAAGNVGRYAVQLARAARLHVLAIASLRAAEALIALGADCVLDRNAPGDVRADAVLDLVGGEHQADLFRFVAPRGALISAVAEPDRTLALERGVDARFIRADVRSDALAKLATLFDQHALVPWIGDVLPLRDACRAHEMLAGAPHAPGRIVLEIKPGS